MVKVLTFIKRKSGMLCRGGQNGREGGVLRTEC
jgi:hypothetical protein